MLNINIEPNKNHRKEAAGGEGGTTSQLKPATAFRIAKKTEIIVFIYL